MTINIADVKVSLEIMWKGMAGLFIVCGFIMLLTMLLSKFMAKLNSKGGLNDK